MKMDADTFIQFVEVELKKQAIENWKFEYQCYCSRIPLYCNGRKIPEPPKFPTFNEEVEDTEDKDIFDYDFIRAAF